MFQGLAYEDREFALQVLAEARKALTERQFQCLLMQLAGFEQAEIADWMGIAQQVVSEHFQAALDEVRRVRKAYATLYGK